MLLKPHITEKTMKQAASKRYTFIVSKLANKTEVKEAVEKIFGVKVLSVKTIVKPGKMYRTGKKWTHKKAADMKKAVVQIKADQKIDLFETADEAKK